MPTKSTAMMMMALIGLTGASALLGGCGQRSLFTDDSANSRGLKYFGDENDTAVGSRERHRQNNEAGFGFANGAAVQ